MVRICLFLLAVDCISNLSEQILVFSIDNIQRVNRFFLLFSILQEIIHVCTPYCLCRCISETVTRSKKLHVFCCFLFYFLVFLRKALPFTAIIDMSLILYLLENSILYFLLLFLFSTLIRKINNDYANVLWVIHIGAFGYCFGQFLFFVLPQLIGLSISTIWRHIVAIASCFYLICVYLAVTHNGVSQKKRIRNWLKFLANAANYKGLSSRNEFIEHCVVVLFCAVALICLDIFIGTDGFFVKLLCCVEAMPFLSLMARRLNDFGMSRWWMIIILAFPLGFIILLLFCISKNSIQKCLHYDQDAHRTTIDTTTGGAMQGDRLL